MKTTIPITTLLRIMDVTTDVRCKTVTLIKPSGTDAAIITDAYVAACNNTSRVHGSPLQWPGM